MTEQWPKDFRVLIPSYKSVSRLTQFVKELTEIVPPEFICVVDDASNDGTYEFCRGAGITCLRHSRNKGKGAALRTGFEYLLTRGGVNWILTMDADGQHSPTDIYRFVKEAREHPGMGLCVGARDMRLGAMPPARILSNRLTSAILSAMTGQWIKDSQCGYRLYSKRLLESIQIEYNRFEMESEVIIKAAAKKIKIHFVRVQTLYLKNNQSHISHLTDTLRWIVATLITTGKKNKMLSNHSLSCERLIATLEQRGITDKRVLEAFRSVPRHEFVSIRAYEDVAVHIGSGQTISQPSIVALMTQLLELNERDLKILEIGTGSGFQTAILARFSRRVFTVERHAELANKARQRLRELGYENITFKTGDGSGGWPVYGPFDRIIVTAGAPVTPTVLSDQLTVGGIMVIPVGSAEVQDLTVYKKTEAGLEARSVEKVEFVPLIGQYGWGDGQC